MTDRVRSLTVVFDRDLRDDDAKKIAALIMNIRRVAAVRLGPVVTSETQIARWGVALEIREKILDLLDEQAGAGK